MKLHTGTIDPRAIKIFKTLERDFNSIHNNTYIYDKVIYKHGKANVTITCKLHGDFEQTPSSHKTGKGCPTCGDIRTREASQGTNNTFIESAIKIHNNKYSYINVNYINAKTKVEILCKKHGMFMQSPNNHLSNGGCSKCGIDAIRKTTKKFLQESNLIHNKRYKYTQVIYKDAVTKVIITCTKHGDFLQQPSQHLQGKGCPSCAKTGFQLNKPGMLYYFKVTDQGNVAWKIGITNRSIEERYHIVDKSRISDIQTVWYGSGQEAWDIEHRIVKIFKKYKYIGPKLLENGNSELFSIDILNKVKRITQKDNSSVGSS